MVFTRKDWDFHGRAVSLPEGTQIEMKTVPRFWSLVRVEEGKARLEMAGIRKKYVFLTELERFFGEDVSKKDVFVCVFLIIDVLYNIMYSFSRPSKGGCNLYQHML